jgi:dienelactone hydrolase
VKKSIVLVLFILGSIIDHAQEGLKKKQLTFADFDKWGYVLQPAITNNGLYAAAIYKKGLNSFADITVQSTISNQKFVINNIKKFAFTLDSKSIIVLTATDTLKTILLSRQVESCKFSAIDFDLLIKDCTEWLIVKTNNTIRIINRISGKESEHPKASAYQRVGTSDFILMTFQDNNKKALTLLNFKSDKRINIGKFNKINNIVISSDGSQIAFIGTADTIKAHENMIWHYEIKTENLKALPLNLNRNMDEKLCIANIDRFSLDNKRLFIYFTESISSPMQYKAKVKVWNYIDGHLSSSSYQKPGSAKCLAFIDLNNYSFVQIQKINENASFFGSNKDELIKIEYLEGSFSESYWNKKAKRKFYIYNCKNRKILPMKILPISLSENNKYIIGIDSLLNNVAYNVNSGNYTLLSPYLDNINSSKDTIDEFNKRWRFFGWMNDYHCILSDGNDLWDINVQSPKEINNLTNGLGKRQSLEFQFFRNDLIEGRINGLHALQAFNNKTKQNGFYKIMSKGMDPEKISMWNSYIFMDNSWGIGEPPVKAKDANVWIVGKESADCFRNFFYTRNFLSFKSVTDYHPEREFNWLKTELINFKTLEGEMDQAILYKPSNFDPQKKYPVIMIYYETVTELLNHYPRPELMVDNINIPFFISQGYLVCYPDIIYAKGKTGINALAAVEGAAKYLSTRDYVNSSSIGIAGHSHGAFETNYIVAHSNYFKAAISACGLSNLVNITNSITIGSGENHQGFAAERGQSRIGYSLWERPNLYIENSAIFQLDSVKTPLLLMANDNDGIVNPEQGIQLFLGLSKLQKPVWLLQYEDEYHNLSKYENALDYTQKALDFFDHYLKRGPMPKWMKVHN